MEGHLLQLSDEQVENVVRYGQEGEGI